MIDAKSSARVTTLLATMTTLAGLVGACTGDEPEPTPRVCISVTDPVTMNAGTFGHKPKIQRTGNGTLVAVYGDAPDGAGMVYDVKGDYERPARDIFVRTCKPDANKSCNAPEHWSAPLNISNSATVS
ncbi:MAG: hypothetical protein KC420_20345, partial [Myxococcales bacterium]|nr:hypothetical protein [Myxococcales bacterium]